MFSIFLQSENTFEFIFYLHIYFVFAGVNFIFDVDVIK